jgi:hypothetical protein
LAGLSRLILQSRSRRTTVDLPSQRTICAVFGVLSAALHRRWGLVAARVFACTPSSPTATSPRQALPLHEQTREHLATATTMYRDMSMTYWLEKAEAESPKNAVTGCRILRG